MTKELTKRDPSKVVQAETKAPVSTRIKVKTDMRAGDAEVGTNGVWSN
jgi:hypothetical protein